MWQALLGEIRHHAVKLCQNVPTYSDNYSEKLRQSLASFLHRGQRTTNKVVKERFLDFSNSVNVILSILDEVVQKKCTKISHLGSAFNVFSWGVILTYWLSTKFVSIVRQVFWEGDLHRLHLSF